MTTNVASARREWVRLDTQAIGASNQAEYPCSNRVYHDLEGLRHMAGIRMIDCNGVTQKPIHKHTTTQYPMLYLARGPP